MYHFCTRENLASLLRLVLDTNINMGDRAPSESEAARNNAGQNVLESGGEGNAGRELNEEMGQTAGWNQSSALPHARRTYGLIPSPSPSLGHTRSYLGTPAPFALRMEGQEHTLRLVSQAGAYTRRLTRAALLFLSVLLGLVCPTAQCLDFELSGSSAYETFKLDGTRAAAFASRFTVQKSGQKWSLVNSPAGSLTTEAVMFDGADVYTLTRNIPIHKTAVAQVPREEIFYTNGVAYARAATAVIFSGQIPLGASAPARLLWEALLAEPVLKASDTAPVPAPWGEAYRPEAVSFDLHVQWPDSAGQFPTAITFVASSQLWESSTRQFGLTNIPPYEDGFIAGRYRVTGWTNVIAGASKVPVPSRFELVRYFPRRYKASSPTAERIACEVANVVVGTREIVPPELGNEVNVLDYRFRDAAFPWLYVVYAVTNRTWKTTNDSSVRELIRPYQSNYIRAQSMRPYRPHTRSPREAERLVYVRVFFLVLLVLAPMAGLLAWLIRYRRTSKAA